jgi:transposase
VYYDKTKNKSYSTEFKQQAVGLVTEQGYSVPRAEASVGITDNITGNIYLIPTNKSDNEV